ncbi:MAG: ribosome biogenesis GTP-binding protein YihA/YsxC [Flavobacteriales bacterium]|jgi:GTP-binding protein|tara:strand:+ start:3955 stop:4563 length:609 start_codon:yes stop_codon:yes gene_type:complete
MNIKSASFVISNKDINKCPVPDKPEYAFIGRSNVGKSSLINMLCNEKNLAKTSQRPGKTQLINHFVINSKTEDPWYLVDLPGYGFAKVPVKLKSKWMGFITSFLKNRQNLLCTFVLIDSRLEPQKIDLEFMEWLGENEIPFVIVFTKTDKLKSAEKKSFLENYKSEMLEVWEEMPTVFVSSAEKHEGKEELLSFISSVNEGW